MAAAVGIVGLCPSQVFIIFVVIAAVHIACGGVGGIVGAEDTEFTINIIFLLPRLGIIYI